MVWKQKEQEVVKEDPEFKEQPQKSQKSYAKGKWSQKTDVEIQSKKEEIEPPINEKDIVQNESKYPRKQKRNKKKFERVDDYDRNREIKEQSNPPKSGKFSYSSLKVAYQFCSRISSPPHPLEMEFLPQALDKSQPNVAVLCQLKSCINGILIPILQNLRPSSKPSGLVIVPTNDSVKEVFQTIESLNSELSITLATQNNSPVANRDIYVTTPAAIFDLTKHNYLDSTRIHYITFVDSEKLSSGTAERLIQYIYPSTRQVICQYNQESPSVARILDYIQTTTKREVRKFGSHQKSFPQASTSDKSHGHHQFLYAESMREKLDLCLNLVRLPGINRSVVFTRSGKSVQEIVDKLDASIKTVSSLKISTLDKTDRVLVTTDSTVPKLDLSNVDLIIQYDMPDTKDASALYTRRTNISPKATVVTLVKTEQEHAAKALLRELGVNDMILRSMRGDNLARIIGLTPSIPRAPSPTNPPIRQSIAQPPVAASTSRTSPERHYHQPYGKQEYYEKRGQPSPRPQEQQHYNRQRNDDNERGRGNRGGARGTGRRENSPDYQYEGRGRKGGNSGYSSNDSGGHGPNHRSNYYDDDRYGIIQDQRLSRGKGSRGRGRVNTQGRGYARDDIEINYYNKGRASGRGKRDADDAINSPPTNYRGRGRKSNFSDDEKPSYDETSGRGRGYTRGSHNEDFYYSSPPNAERGRGGSRGDQNRGRGNTRPPSTAAVPQYTNEPPKSPPMYQQTARGPPNPTNVPPASYPNYSQSKPTPQYSGRGGTTYDAPTSTSPAWSTQNVQYDGSYSPYHQQSSQPHWSNNQSPDYSRQPKPSRGKQDHQLPPQHGISPANTRPPLPMSSQSYSTSNPYQHHQHQHHHHHHQHQQQHHHQHHHQYQQQQYHSSSHQYPLQTQNPYSNYSAQPRRVPIIDQSGYNSQNYSPPIPQNHQHQPSNYGAQYPPQAPPHQQTHNTYSGGSYPYYNEYGHTSNRGGHRGINAPR